MKFAVILPFAVQALAGVARRQADQLPAAILAIASATNTTNDAILAFNGDGTDLASASEGTLAAINNADAVAQASAQLTLDQLIALIDPTNQLNAAVNTTIDNTIAARQALVDACLGPTVLQGLLAQQAASTQLTNDLAAKAPDGFADAVRQSSGVAAASLQQGIDAFADAPGCASTTTSAAQETTTSAESDATATALPETTTTAEEDDGTTATIEPPVYPTVYPTEAPYYPTEAPYYPTEAPSTYPIKPTEYETSYVYYCPITSGSPDYHYSTVTVTIYPTEHPAPTSYPAKETQYITEYVTYVPATTTVVVDNKPKPTTYAVVKTVTVTVPAKETAPAAQETAPAAYHPAPSSPVQQIGDGQVQNPAKPGNNPVQQIGDGQVQNPAKPAPAGNNPVQQIGDGQIQNPAKAGNGTSSPAKPETYTGAASKAQAVGFGVVAIMVAAVAL